MITVNNPCSMDKINPEFLPILGEAIGAYREVLANSVYDIRLLGSVPRGEAVIGQSDIDFMVVLTCAPSDEQCRRLEQRASDLHEKFPVVSNVDLGYAALSGIDEFQRFIFSSDSVSLYGEDSFTRYEQQISAEHLANLVTPNIKTLPLNYARAVEQIDEHDTQKLFQGSRWCGKDIIKCLRREAILRECRYERTIQGAYQQLQRCFPDHAKLLDALLDLYENPKQKKQSILLVLKQVVEKFVSKEQNEIEV